MVAAAVVAGGAGSWRPAAARVYSGSLANSGATPFIARFAFGPSSGSTPSGSMVITYSTPQLTLNWLGYIDTTWAQVYGSSLTCTNQQSLATSVLPLPAGVTRATQTISQPGTAHYWYFVMSNQPGCNNVQVSTYTVTFLQADGSQLSYDELGLPAVYAVSVGVYVLATAVHIYVHYFRRPRFAPTLVHLFTITLVAFTLSNLSELVQWTSVARTGMDNTSARLAAASFLLIGVAAMWTLAGLAANGHGIYPHSLRGTPRRPWRGGCNLVGLAIGIVMMALLAAGIVAPIFATTIANPAADITSWPLIVLIIVLLLYVVWFVRMSRLALRDTDRKQSLWRVQAAVALLFAITPLSEITGLATPEYMRTRIKGTFGGWGRRRRNRITHTQYTPHARTHAQPACYKGTWRWCSLPWDTRCGRRRTRRSGLSTTTPRRASRRW